MSTELFNGATGTVAPFKADLVSMLVENSVQSQISNLLQAKAYAAQDSDAGVPLGWEKVAEALTKPEIVDGVLSDEKKTPEGFKIGIIGAGIAGLYTAYILKELNVDYEILEANPERLGGRILTHHFNLKNIDSQEGSNGVDHHYYDIGAMRFPNSPIMRRTFDLFRRLKIGDPGMKPEPENRLIPYYMKGKNCPTAYNDHTALITPNEDGTESEDNIAKEGDQKHEDDPFKVSTKYWGPVPESRVSSEATEEILGDAFDRFRAKITKAEQARFLAQDTKLTEEERTAKKKKALEDLHRAFEYLMRHDKYSLREYLQNVEGYDPETVHWLETIDSASGWYDQAFTENVLESLAFSYSDAANEEEAKSNAKTKWYCIEGGTRVVIDRIKEGLTDKISMNKLVTKMKLQYKDKNEKKPIPDRVSVTFRDTVTEKGQQSKLTTRDYSAVINTTTLGALGKIDMSEMHLPYGMKTAVRVLRYDSSSKIGVLFKRKWWQDDFGISLGGLAKTDMPIRVCVYPSYNIDDPKDKPAVLLASYTWGQDSERIASHISTNSPEGDQGLRELVVNNLARLHTVEKPDESEADYRQRLEKNRAMIDGEWIEHHAYDWSKDPYSAGAFALFGPGQFTTLIPHLLQPASDGRFVVIGEHASANHAWIVGALDSAVRGLKQIFMRFGMKEQLDAMINRFDDVDELRNETVAKQVILSRLPPSELARLRPGDRVIANVPGAGQTV